MTDAVPPIGAPCASRRPGSKQGGADDQWAVGRRTRPARDLRRNFSLRQARDVASEEVLKDDQIDRVHGSRTVEVRFVSAEVNGAQPGTMLPTR